MSKAMRHAATAFLVGMALMLCLPAFALDWSPLLGDDGPQRAAVFIGVGMVGMVAHWAKKWLRGELGAGLWEYLAVQHPKRTALAVMSFVGAALGLWVSGQLATMEVGALVLTAATTGYTCDSAINKGLDV